MHSQSAWDLCLTPIFPPDDHYISVDLAVSTYLSVEASAISVQPAQNESASGLPPSSGTPFPVAVIQTNYDHHSVVNTCFTAKHNRQENIAWTNSRRRKAELGIVAQDIEELHSLVIIIYLPASNGSLICRL